MDTRGAEGARFISRRQALALRAAVADLLRGRPLAGLTGDDWERAIGATFGCEPVPDGQRQYGALDRWGSGRGWLGKTILVNGRQAGHLWPNDTPDRALLLPGDAADPAPLRVEFQWGRVHLPISRLARLFDDDKAHLAGGDLLRRLAGDLAAACDARELTAADVALALGLRHPSEARLAYAELPHDPALLDPAAFEWTWQRVPADVDEEASDPVSLEGTTPDGRLVWRYYPLGGHARIRLTTDPARVARLALPAAAYSGS